MKNYNVLAMDFGASSGRGIIGHFNGEKIELEEIHRFENNPVKLAGRLLWDVPSLYSAILASIGASVKSDGGISSVGIDTWGVDYGFIDKNSHLLANPTHYRDTRTESARNEVLKKIPFEELYGITGIQDLSFNTVYQLYCDFTKDRHISDSVDKMLFMPDLFNYFLTGIAATEYTIASTGAVLDAKTENFAKDILNRLGIPEGIFAPIVYPSNVLGTLTRDVKESTGAGDGIKVVNTASHDTGSAVIAVPALEDEFLYISSGTWSLLGTELKSPLINEASCKYSFTNEGGACGTVRFLKNIAGLWLSQESRRQWKREGKNYSFDELAAMAASAESMKYIIDPDSPEFTPPGNMPERIADFCERTGQGRPETPGEIIRCIFDSLALRYRWGAEKIREITGISPKAVYIVGGGTKEKELCALAADVTGLPVYAGPVEATALGNIAAQLISSGEIGGIAEAREIIRRSYPVCEYVPHTEFRCIADAAYERFLKLI